MNPADRSPRQVVRLLVIDNDPTDREVLRRAFSGISPRYEVSEANTLGSGLQLLEAGQEFECVLVDSRLPDGTALDCIEQLRQGESALMSAPVIVIAGADDDGIGLESLARGAQDYLLRSECTEASLTRSVRYALERHGLQLSLQDRERQLRQAQKVEAMGQIASSVAHDFNNLVSVVVGYTELALEALDDGRPVRRYLEAVLRGGQRATALTHQLLAFGRDQVLDPKIVDLNELLGQACELLVPQALTDQITLSLRPGAGVGQVKVDVNQAEQAILNLAINARDAMPEGGVMTLVTSNVEVEANSRTPEHAGVSPGAYVLLEVRDSGIGMSEEVLAQVLEPFFTTKPEGQGTGLGLASVLRFVHQSGGVMRVDSAPGEGTTVSMLFPRFSDPVSETEDLAVTPYPATQPGANLLLVEDEELVRKLEAECLTRAGFHVLEVANGRAALDVLLSGEAAIDAVVSDVVMPVMGGVALAREIAAHGIDVPILFLSGYTKGEHLKEVLRNGSLFVRKPVSPTELVKAVHKLLKRARR